MDCHRAGRNSRNGAALAVIPQDEHGGNIYAVARQKRRPFHRLVDFSASINPLGPSPRVRQAVLSAWSALVHYPDPDHVSLRTALGKEFRLAPDWFAIGNGSCELIHLLPRALSLRRVMIIGPTFSEYARAVGLAGGQVLNILAQRSDGYRPPLREALRSLQVDGSGIDAVFLCNPNSPTGQVVSQKDLAELVQVAECKRIWVIVDEAFVDYCEEQSVVPRLASHLHLLVIRSFTKFYGLPGLRAGYLVGNPEVLSRIRTLQPPWSVNTLAQLAALAALRDRSHARRSLAFMKAERKTFGNSLAQLPGVTVFPAAANFLLVELPPGRSAAVLCMALCQQGILVRDCSPVPGLNDRTIRIAVRTPPQNRRLVSAVRRYLIYAGV